MRLIDEKWEQIFDRYDVAKEIERNGLFHITANQIKEFKEPRLMTKFDTRESLPRVFGDKLGILPVTRGSYVIGEFDLYEDFPEIKDNTLHSGMSGITTAKIPDYLTTVDIHHISSEAAAINVMGIAAILDDFLNEENLLQTVSGRMGSGKFSFSLSDEKRTTSTIIQVENSQLEIDGGFESKNGFVLVEGKNVVHSNFLIRQLYYPLRLWESKINKPIRPVFMVYSNEVFRLLEYTFTDTYDYNSIQLVQERLYSLEDNDISFADLLQVCKEARLIAEPEVPFPQADSFEKVISLLENLAKTPMTTGEIAELFGFRERQSDYYYNACRYLGLAEKSLDEEKMKRVFISEKGKALLSLPYKKRQKAYVAEILQHGVFRDVFKKSVDLNRIPDKEYIANQMRKEKLCSESLISRRAGTVSGWMRWIFNLCR